MKKLLQKIAQRFSGTQPSQPKEASGAGVDDTFYLWVNDTIEIYGSLETIAANAEPWQLAECLVVGSQGTIYTGSTPENGHIAFSSTGINNQLLLSVILAEALANLGYTRATVDEMSLDELSTAARTHLC